MIKILHLISDLSTGGAEWALYRLLSRIDKSRFENVVVSLTDLGTLGCSLENLGIRVYTLGERRKSTTKAIGKLRFLYLWLVKSRTLVDILRKERPLILQTWLYHADFIGLKAGKKAKIPLIAWNLRCTDLQNMSQRIGLRMLSRKSSQPALIIVNSRSGQKFHEERGYQARKWQYIPNGIDLEKFCPDSEARVYLWEELKVLKESLVIGLVARYHPIKGHETFLRAAQLLLEDFSKTKFVLIGLGADLQNKQLRMLISTLNLGEAVYLLGQRKDIPRLSAAFDIATSSSYSESFPTVIAEAMACGIPCVATDVGDSKWLIGDTGRVVPPRDSLALAESWKDLITIGSNGRRDLGLAARLRMKQHFEIGNIVSQYEHCYHELVSSLGNYE